MKQHPSCVRRDAPLASADPSDGRSAKKLPVRTDRSYTGNGNNQRLNACKVLPSLFAALWVGGCVNFSSDGEVSAVRSIVGPSIGHDVVKVSTAADAAVARNRVVSLLRGPLTAEKAVAIALLNNRGLQAAYNQLGVSEAQYVQASLPPNPRVTLTDFGGKSPELELQVVTDVVALATLPIRTDIAASFFKAARFSAAETTLTFVTETRRQYYRAVAANEEVVFLQQARLLAEAGSEITKQLGETGAVNKLDQAREHALYAEIASQLARATLGARVERERLTRLLGLWGRDLHFVLPNRLPPLPKTLRTGRQIEAEAIRRRVDLQVARAELAALAKVLGLIRVVRYVPLFEFGGLGDFQKDSSAGGFATTFEIPIFDFGQARVVNAEQTYMQAANLLAQKAVEIRSEAREAYQGYRGTYDIVKLYQQQILPLQDTIQADSLKQYSGMLVDVSQLILDARLRVLSNAQAIAARRDFWIATADLNAALVGGTGRGSEGPGRGSGAGGGSSLAGMASIAGGSGGGTVAGSSGAASSGGGAAASSGSSGSGAASAGGAGP